MKKQNSIQVSPSPYSHPITLISFSGSILFSVSTNISITTVYDDPNCLFEHVSTTCCSLLQAELTVLEGTKECLSCEEEQQQEKASFGMQMRKEREPPTHGRTCSLHVSNLLLGSCLLGVVELVISQPSFKSSHSPVATIKKLFTLVSIFFCLYSTS